MGFKFRAVVRSRTSPSSPAANGAVGFVTATVARLELAGKMAHDDLVCPPPVPPFDHPTRGLALCSLHPSYRDVEDLLAERGLDVSYEISAAMGLEVRAVVRSRTSPSSPAANGAVGFVTATVARLESAGKMAHDDLVCPPPVPPFDHPTRGLALCSFRPQLSRRRRSAR